MAALTIRPATRSDLPDLVNLVVGKTGRRMVENRLAEHEAGYRHMLVAELDGRVVGTVSVGGVGHQLPDSLRLFALDVGENYRRRGVGSALVGAVEGRALEMDLRYVNLEVSIENEDAVRLYRRLGFEVVEGPVDDSWLSTVSDGRPERVTEKVWIMVKELLGAPAE